MPRCKKLSPESGTSSADSRSALLSFTLVDEKAWGRAPSNGYQASTWRTVHFECDKATQTNRIYCEMYGGPRRPNLSPFQGRSRAPSPNFRPRFENPGFPPPGHNVYPSQRQPFPPSQRPFVNNPGPHGARLGFQPRAWQAAGPRESFRPTGYPEERMYNRVCTFIKYMKYRNHLQL